jgi:alpha-tubulin suppressor-like RCC1 family protein
MPGAVQSCFCEGANAWLSCQPCVPACTLNPGDIAAHRPLAGGDAFMCGVTASGGVKCWGAMAGLGDGSDAGRPVPGPVPGLTDVVSIAAGATHACALTSAGAVKCWGENSAGQLGDRSTMYRGTPVDAYGLSSGVRAITAGVGHTCAITTGGGLKCWGSNSSGQLGDRTSNNYAIAPQDVYSLTSGVAAVACGEEHTCAALIDGTVKCWGTGTKGENGTGSMQTAPVMVSGISGALALAAGWGHTCALLVGGEVKCWGQNWAAQLGLGYADPLNAYPAPMTVMNLSSGAGWITAGLAHTCVTMNDGTSQCWGWNNFGQLGNGASDAGGTNPPLYVAQPEPGGPPQWSVGLAAGSRTGCAFAPGPMLQCWGDNIDGDVGDGTTMLRPYAVTVPGF